MSNGNMFRLLQNQSKAIKQLFEKTAPRAVGALAVREFIGHFRSESWTDENDTTHIWKPRKVQKYRRRGVGNKKGTASRLSLTKAGKSDRGRAILVLSGILRGSLRHDEPGNGRTVASTDVPYAEAHNEGTSKLPKRQFMGHSANLNREIEKYIDPRVKKIMQ
jgi:phage gpG-like protein